MKTFRSADGTDRCCGCHLHPCECTCNPEHPMNRIIHAIWPLLRKQVLNITEDK